MSADASSGVLRRPDTLSRVFLGVIAVCLVALTADRLATPLTPQALAAPGGELATGRQGLVGAGAQRQEMIAELRRMNAQLQRLETRIAEGVQVELTGVSE